MDIRGLVITVSVPAANTYDSAARTVLLRDRWAIAAETGLAHQGKRTCIASATCGPGCSPG
ncbi:hypothetical protein [Streptomyces sp. B8F3]|uniref:hypothetical protein n=1 Tax=unclassified Streptomyces TaxID=2593676 RepID=UPI00325F4387